MGIGISEIKNTKKDEVVVNCVSVQDRNKLKEAVENNPEKNLDAVVARRYRPRIKVSAVKGIKHLSCKEIKDIVVQQNKLNVRREGWRSC